VQFRSSSQGRRHGGLGRQPNAACCHWNALTDRRIVSPSVDAPSACPRTDRDQGSRRNQSREPPPQTTSRGALTNSPSIWRDNAPVDYSLQLVSGGDRWSTSLFRSSLGW